MAEQNSLFTAITNRTSHRTCFLLCLCSSMEPPSLSQSSKGKGTLDASMEFTILLTMLAFLKLGEVKDLAMKMKMMWTALSNKKILNVQANDMPV